MKIAILSDIHGNIDALNEILKSPKFESCDLRVNVGDMVGYYFEPKEVLKVIKGADFKSVKGNHELMLEKALFDSQYRLEITSTYGVGHSIALQQLSGADLNYLNCLPQNLTIEIPEGNLLICHGSPKSASDYIYPDTILSVNQFELSKDIRWMVCGNTHWQMVRREDDLLIINPGSVGQARDKSGLAHWAILDSVTNEIEFLQTKYDVASLISCTKRLNPDLPRLWEVLGG
jgi:putative phosphoesterase